MKTIGCVAAVAAASLFCGCVSVETSKAPNVNLAQYRTFAWFEPASPSPRQQSFERSPAGAVVREQIARNLAAKGVSETAQNPDFLVAYHGKLEQRMDVTDWGYPGWWWGGWGGPNVAVSEYTQGTLIIDFIDPRTKQVFWRGTASAVVNQPENPNPKKLAGAVDKVMKKYPAEVASAAPRQTM
jgi:hypothetical protein